jgi:hypothetical protein
LADSLAPESLPVLEQILAQAKEYDNQPKRTLADGTEALDAHGLHWWLLLLHNGDAELPERIPHVVMLAWRDGYRGTKSEAWPGPAPWSPGPVWRCEDCRMALPNAYPGGRVFDGGCMRPCPVCNGRRLAHMNFSEPWGKSWRIPRNGTQSDC